MKIKKFEEFRNSRLNESLVDVSDDLKSNFRSYEYDHDNEEDANGLWNILIERHPDEDPEKLKEFAYNWTGYESKVDESKDSKVLIDNPELEELLNSEGDLFKQEIRGEKEIVTKFLGKGKTFIDIDTMIDTDDFGKPIKREGTENSRGDESDFKLYKTKSGKLFIVNQFSTDGGQSDSINIIWKKD